MQEKQKNSEKKKGLGKRTNSGKWKRPSATLTEEQSKDLKKQVDKIPLFEDGN